ncbi:MAG: type I secretion system permease/ATPase, partial [Ideonella sp.]
MTSNPDLAARTEPRLDSAPAAPIGPDEDALLQGLIWLTFHHGRPRSPASLLAGVAIDGALRPDQAVRVMQEAGYHASLIERPLAELSALLMPVVALLRDGDACIISRRVPGKGKAAPRYEIVLPAAGGATCLVAEEELAAEYLGHVLAVAPRVQPGQTDNPLLQQGRHWLWGTLRRFMPYYRS